MSKLDKMIKELCPEGVEYVKLGELCTFVRGKTITEKDTIEGNIPVIAGGQKPSYFHNEHNKDGESITVAGSGAYAGFVSFWNVPIWVSDAFTVEPNDKAITKYVYYFLLTKQQRIFETQKGAGVPHVHGKDIANFEIPLPPLPIQQKIVSVLDSFTTLIDKMKHEVEKRKKQMEYYREKLLTFEDGECEWKTLGEICNCKTGTKPMIIQENGLYEYINAGTSNSGFVDIFNTEGDTVTTPSRGQGGIGYVGYQKYSFWCGPLCYKIQSKKANMLNKFIFYYLSTFNDLILQFKCEGGTPAFNLKDLQSIEIPTPSLTKQSSIVSTLDKFESYITKLEKMIVLRQKQYEYYREQLLTFE